VAQTRRVLFAKKLLDETELPVVQVAMAAGYASVRRFNDAVRAAWGRPPRELRRARNQARAPGEGSELTLQLAYRPPLAWPELLAFLAARAIPRVESVAGGAYQRSVEVAGVPGTVRVRPAPRGHALLASVRLREPVSLVPLVARLRRLFDLEADPRAIEAGLAADPWLAPAVAARPGLRVPGAWDGFELAVRAILGQQVSVRGATTLAGRLAERWGEPGAAPAGESTDLRFPSPERLARARLEAIGLPAARAGAIRALAAAVADGSLVLDGTAEPEATRAALLALPGIGAWTADYVAMRALREPDAFPAGDLGLRRALADAAGRLPSAAALEERSAAWRPWRAYAALYLWQGAAAPSRSPVAARSPSRGRAPSRSSSRRLRALPNA
jgi:AraC family transcriptional regulator of adaptative response / DNA-3-methyladenine glycosylase II